MFPVIASSTCSFFNPRAADGASPQNQNTQFQFASSTCVFTYPREFFEARATTSSSATPVFITGYAQPTTTATGTIGLYPYISAGEMLLVFFAFLFTAYIILRSVIQSISKISTGKKVLQYGGGDVEIRHDV